MGGHQIDIDIDGSPVVLTIQIGMAPMAAIFSYIIGHVILPAVWCISFSIWTVHDGRVLGLVCHRGYNN
jgi:hypothetical protein